MPNSPDHLAGRQVHLDFHTSEHIPGVGADFDPRAFADTFRRAHVTSVTVFAKCHHGWTYFPGPTCPQHPQLGGRDLLGEQIEALHRAGIRCPVYITVGWDALSARLHPEWRAQRRDGMFADWDGRHPGRWRFLNWLHPEYVAHIEGVTRDVLDRYGREVDGFFFDIVFFTREACWSPESVRFRERHGLLEDSAAGFQRFQARAQAEFAAHMSAVVRGVRPNASLFYNAGGDAFVEAEVGAQARYAHMSHMEVESLPSGFWGYHHFPRIARQVRHWGKPWVGMTGRFQTMWGDFGGLKPQAALEYECFRTQALGGCCSVGDQLHPRGAPEPAAYDLIGAVYAQVAEAEPLYHGSWSMPQIGIVTSGHAAADPALAGKIDEGAVLMCEEEHYDARVLDETSDLAGLDCVLVTDAAVVSEAFAARLEAFWRAGGRLVVAHRGGRDADGRWMLGFLPVRTGEPVAAWPTYWRACGVVAAACGSGVRVVYERGVELEAAGGEVLVERLAPYFRRDDVRYCSHLQTPPDPSAPPGAAVVAAERCVVFGEPVFREYRQHGNVFVRRVWAEAMRRLVGPAPFGAGLSTNILVVPRKRGGDLLLTLLHYVPVRKSLTIDVIEERGAFAGERLRLPPAARVVRVAGGGAALPRAEDGAFLLPDVRGRLLLEVPGFFPAG